MMHFLRYSYTVQNNILTFNKLNTRLQENYSKHKFRFASVYQFRTSSSFNSAFDSYRFLKVF